MQCYSSAHSKHSTRAWPSIALAYFLLARSFSFAGAWISTTPTVEVAPRHSRCVMLSSASQRSISKSEKSTSERIWDLLQQNFQGDFDNYNQVIQDREKGLLPREGGGHENFHCTLIPVSEFGRLAAFYFDGNPQRIFRFRYYQLLPITKSSTNETSVEMKLYTLTQSLESLLRENSETPMEWPQLFRSFGEDTEIDGKIDYLSNCEITWSLDIDPEQHTYIKSDSQIDGSLHAVMVHGEAIVDSTVIPGIKIRILDQLSLFDDVFYINDRGLDPDTGVFIYGNQRGVPYRLERVAHIQGGERIVANDDLSWTLGAQWRTKEEYKTRIDSIGGPSVQMRAPPKPKSSE